MNCQSRNHRLEEVIKRIAYTDPAAPAIVSSKYNPFSYSQLVWQIEHVASSLSKSGLKKSARIAIAVKDTAPAALAIVAVACSAAAIPLDQNLAAAEIELRLKLLDVDAVCVLAGETTVTRTVAADEFRRFMSAQLSWNKVPRRVHIRESIPKGLGGKALRKKLSEVDS